MLTSVFPFHWDEEWRFVEAKDFLKSMLKTFSAHGDRLKTFIATIKMILGSLSAEKECNDAEGFDDYQEHIQMYDETEEVEVETEEYDLDDPGHASIN